MSDSRQAQQKRLSRARIVRRAAALDQEARDRANDAIARSEAHERLCTERWDTQARAMARIEKTMEAVETAITDKIGRLPAGIIAALFGLVGFLGARAWPTH